MLLAVDLFNSVSDLKMGYSFPYYKTLPLNALYKIIDLDDLVMESILGSDLLSFMKAGVAIKNLRLTEDGKIECINNGVFDFNDLVGFGWFTKKNFSSPKFSMERIMKISTLFYTFIMVDGNLFGMQLDYCTNDTVALMISHSPNIDMSAINSKSGYDYAISLLDKVGWKPVCSINKLFDLYMHISYMYKFGSHYVVEVIFTVSPVLRHMRLLFILDSNLRFVDFLYFVINEYEVERLCPVADKVFHSKLIYRFGGS